MIAACLWVVCLAGGCQPAPEEKLEQIIAEMREVLARKDYDYFVRTHDSGFAELAVTDPGADAIHNMVAMYEAGLGEALYELLGTVDPNTLNSHERNNGLEVMWATGRDPDGSINELVFRKRHFDDGAAWEVTAWTAWRPDESFEWPRPLPAD
ncbi:MAG: hypothetical protein AAF078_09090 [Planctomycetota bacterium]